MMTGRERDSDSGSISRMGILGGAFDPIHNGHLALAASAKQRFDLEAVVFVPSYCPPHKSRPVLAPFEHRLAMIDLAIEQEPGFLVSDLESRQACPSYAGEMVQALQRQYGCREDSCYFITGLDAIVTLTDWAKSRTYPGLCRFVATTRPGFDSTAVKQEVPESFHPYIFINEMPAISISSTDIKYRIRNNLPIQEMVPVKVEEYITTYKIYTHCFS